jgi:hypothetical protein
MAISDSLPLLAYLCHLCFTVLIKQMSAEEITASAKHKKELINGLATALC